MGNDKKELSCRHVLHVLLRVPPPLVQTGRVLEVFSDAQMEGSGDDSSLGIAPRGVQSLILPVSILTLSTTGLLVSEVNVVCGGELE